MTCKHYAYTEKRMPSLSKCGKSVIAVLLALLIATSSLYLLCNLFVKADAASTNGQTKYNNISDFQKERWTEIQNSVFNESNKSVIQASEIKNRITNKKVAAGNEYFNWTNTGIDSKKVWDGNSLSGDKATSYLAKNSKITINYSDSVSYTYTVYNVSTPQEFRYIMKKFQDLVEYVYFEKCDSRYTSLIAALESVGVDSSLASSKDYRKSIAILNGINNYTGTAPQNTQMLSLLKAGKLIKRNDAEYIKINITADLDMGGQNGQIWDPIETDYCRAQKYYKYLYIEGNGHTIYNLSIYTDSEISGAGLFSRPPAFLVVKNLGFQSSMVVHGYDEPGKNTINNLTTTAGLISAFSPQKFYFYNVHSNGAYMQITDKKNASTGGGIGGLIGRKDIAASLNLNYVPANRPSFENGSNRGDTGDCFFKNCSTQNLYMYGSDHIGGLTSFMGMRYDTLNGSYNSTIPDAPEQYVFKRVDYCGAGTMTASDDLKKANNYYPVMVENCYSVDSTIFSTGHDSGAFISCGHGIIANNCFTNNIIYATDNTGGFIGRVSSVYAGHIKDANENYTLGSCFNNCYSSGIVEGSTAMGGFVGLDNSRRERSKIYSYSEGVKTSFKDISSTLYNNCYSTAMVGMDYAGKYVGGFIGLDDNYNLGRSDGSSPTVMYEGGKVSGKGSFYVNCYAAGEVGNILTVTDRDDDTLAMQDDYFKNYEGKNTEGQILNYYPTGGFAGAAGLDIFNYKYDKGRASDLKNIDKVGNFYNCYYDMQTTAMHEMAVGISNTKTSLDEYEVNQFQLTGVTGLYTVDSDVKKVPGLTGTPKSYSGSKSFSMDKAEEKSTVWSYNNEYYPQLSVFMHSDTTRSNILEATDSDVNISSVTSSPFFIKNTEQNVANESHPVMSLANHDTRTVDENKVTVINNIINTNSDAAQLAGVVYPYRYSQASTSTVLLDHWDYTMDTETGASIDDNTNWDEPGIEDNKMVKITEGERKGEWVKEYTNLQAGRYEFKVQAGQSMSYNYGRTKFNDTENIVLDVPTDNCDVKLRFKYNEIGSSDFYVIAEITDEKGNTTVEKLTSPDEYKVVKYTVAGSLPNYSWNAEANDSYTMTYAGDEKTYTLKIDGLAVGNYQFKITDGGGWTNNWGQDGKSGGSNMSFSVVNGPADVTITFDESTKKCTVTANPSDNLAEVVTGEKKIDFTGYSVITSSSQITGYEWLATKEGKEKEAAEAGKLTFNEATGLYEASFTLYRKDALGVSNFDQNYAYKVIKDAVDEGENSGFYVGSPEDDSLDEIKLNFYYNADTGETNVTSTPAGIIKDSYKADTYSVVGDKNLTGYEWLENQQAGIDGQMAFDGNSKTKYTKTYYNLGPGSYSFKVLPDCLDGKWSSPVSYGDSTKASGNYEFTILDEVNGQTITSVTVTIKFDSETGKIRVLTDPTGCIKTDEYVLMGTTKLMEKITGSDGKPVGRWNKNEPIMEYDEEAGKYYYTIKDVPVNDQKMNPTEDYLPVFNYAYKVINKGKDTGENQYFVLGGKLAAQDNYDLKFYYDPLTKASEVLAYDDEGKEVTGKVISYNYEDYFYSLLGDKNLTGYDWDVSHAKEAAYAGLMTYSESEGVYKTTYRIKSPKDVTTLYSFKIAANGTFDSGRSWGAGGLNDNNNFIVSVASADPLIQEVNLNITFNSKTGEVTYTTDPDVSSPHAVDNFDWYVCGTSTLKSDNAFKYDVTVYDTVRDITSGFTFTCGQDTEKERGLTWAIDEAYNTASGFNSKTGFEMSYSQNYAYTDKDGNEQNKDINIKGKFNSDVVQLEVQPIQDGIVPEFNVTDEKDKIKFDDILAQFYVNKCMPGKQWLKVTTVGYGASDKFIEWKNQYLAYYDYVEKNKDYQNYFNRYLAILGGTDYPGSAEGVVTENNLLDYCYENEGTNRDVASRLKLPENTTLTTLYETKENCEVKTKPDEKYPTVDNQSIVGSRYLRLIPTSYLEAGNDAKINVVQSDEDLTGKDALNYVKYEAENSDNGTSFTLEDKNKKLDVQPFNYYNFAVTAAYMSTDKVGLGIYNNYNANRVVEFNQGLLRDGDDEKVRNSNSDGTGEKFRYFAMTSAYNNTENGLGVASYSDKDSGGKLNPNLTLSSFVNESIVGNSYTEKGAEKVKAKTIVKVFKKNITESGDEILNLVHVENDNSGQETIYSSNYKKWTGTKKFTVSDQGDYLVSFYWALSDGRYLKDTKEVEVRVVQPGITKKVDKTYDSTDNKNELTYTVSYTNNETNENLNFALLDILPFDKSMRAYEKDADNEHFPVSDINNENFKFNLESMELSFTNDSTVVKGIYYSTDSTVRSLLDNSSKYPSEKSASKLGLTNDGLISEQYFTKLDKNIGEDYNENLGVKDTEYSYSSGMRYNKVKNVTALAVTGVELGIGETITLEFKLSYDATREDYYVNDSAFFVKGQSREGVADKDLIQLYSNSNPVETAIVARDVTGYAFLDTNRDGIKDANEQILPGMTVKLYKDGKQYGDSVKTDENGKYIFKDVPSGDLTIKFEPEDGETVTFKNSSGNTTKAYAKNLLVSDALVEEDANGQLDGSRNLFSANMSEADETGKKCLESAEYTVRMPKNELIYSGNYKADYVYSLIKLNYTATNRVYTKQFQNAGFYPDYSMSINKVDQNENAVSGVGFMLECKVADETTSTDNEGNEKTDTETNWYPVYYEETEEGKRAVYSKQYDTVDKLKSAGKEYILYTDDDGSLMFDNLFSADYRFTEVSVPAGSNIGKLQSSIYFSLPYDVGDREKAYDCVVDENGAEITGLAGDRIPASDETVAKLDLYKYTQDESGNSVLGSDVLKSTKPDDLGNYSFNNLDSGKYLVKSLVWGDYEKGFKSSDEVFAIEGKILDESSAPVKNADVYLYQCSRDSKGNLVYGSKALKTAKTDENGNYRFDELKSGDYCVKCPTLDDYERIFDSSEDIFVIDGKYLDEDSKPVKNATVYLYECSRDSKGNLICADDALKIGKTDANGYYKFDNLNSGDYCVRNIVAGKYEKEYSVNPQSIDYSVKDNVGKLTGIAFDNNSKPLSAINVYLYKYDKDEAGNWKLNKTAISRVRTNSDGEFTFSNLAQGKYVVKYVTDGDYMNYANATAISFDNDYIEIDGKRYYDHVTFEVANPNNQFKLPQTGGFDGLYIALTVGLLLLGAGITVFALAKKKRSAKNI